MDKTYFPLKKKIAGLNNSPTDFLLSYKTHTEIPIYPHPGSFGFKRKNHIHEGIDLYAEQGDDVIAIESGQIVSILPFTGKIAQCDWWHDTWCVMVKSKSGVICYGEIIPEKRLYVGSFIFAGMIVGKIETVLKNDKGRPMAMLHLELYDDAIVSPNEGWNIGENQPKGLKDPMILLKPFLPV